MWIPTHDTKSGSNVPSQWSLLWSFQPKMTIDASTLFLVILRFQFILHVFVYLPSIFQQILCFLKERTSSCRIENILSIVEKSSDSMRLSELFARLRKVKVLYLSLNCITKFSIKILKNVSLIFSKVLFLLVISILLQCPWYQLYYRVSKNF